MEYIKVSELMNLASIDGDYNQNRVQQWLDAGIATIENATGYILSNDTKNPDSDKKPFVDLANIYLQEYARSNYLAPNYPTENQRHILLRLRNIADKLIEKQEADNGQSTDAKSSNL